MSSNHGNTIAAWTGVAVAMLGFVVGGIGLMFNPVSMPVFWVGVAIGVASIVVYAAMVKLGYND